MAKKYEKIRFDEDEFKAWFTPEMVKKIKAFDKNALRDTFLRFENELKALAYRKYNVLRNNSYYSDYTVDDYIAQIYLDMPYYSFDSASHFSNSCFIRLSYIKEGGWYYIKNYNPKLNDRKLYYADVIPLYVEHSSQKHEKTFSDDYCIVDFLGIGEKSLEEEYLEKYDSENLKPATVKLLNYCKSLLTPRMLEAFELACDGYNMGQIMSYTGKKTCALYGARIKLLKHYNELKPLLQEANLYSREFDSLASKYCQVH